MTIDELKSLVRWARENGVKRMRVGDAEFELDADARPYLPSRADTPTSPKDITDDMVPLLSLDPDSEDEDIMFWSSES